MWENGEFKKGDWWQLLWLFEEDTLRLIYGSDQHCLEEEISYIELKLIVEKYNEQGVRGSDGKFWCSKKEIGGIEKNVEGIVNKENNVDVNVGGDAVEGQVDNISIDVAVPVLKEMKTEKALHHQIHH